MRESFSQLEERTKRAATLDELFCLWKDAHAAEANAEGNTFPLLHEKGKAPQEPNDPRFKESFCPDGAASFDRKHLQSEKTKVVFVLKESHLEKTSKVNCAAQLDKYFWFGECDQDDKSYKRYAGNLKKAMRALGEEVRDDPFGYVNLNKRGGFGRTDYTRLKNYAKRYRAFLKRQLALMAPEKIVFCGCYDGAAEYLFEFCDNKDKKWRRQPVYARLEGKPVTLYYIYHPACTRFEKSLEYLKNQPEL